MSCTKNEVDFTWSPTTPRAGQTVRFSNLSSSGEDWEWEFGDVSTSSAKSPSKVYRKPGTYVVKLTVDGKSAWTASHVITVLDTVPTISYESESPDAEKNVGIFRSCTFSADAYNPYNHRLTYHWTIDEPATWCSLLKTVAGEDSVTGQKLKVYFTRPQNEVTVRVEVRESYSINGHDTLIVRPIAKTIKVVDVAAPAVLSRTAESDYSQRGYLVDRMPVFEEAMITKSAAVRAALDAVQDTACDYNRVRYSISAPPALPGGDVALGLFVWDGRVYYRTDRELVVASLSGTDRVSLASGTVKFLQADRQANRLYWADASGLYYMPFILSDNNRPQPGSTVVVNKLPGIQKIAFTE